MHNLNGLMTKKRQIISILLVIVLTASPACCFGQDDATAILAEPIRSNTSDVESHPTLARVLAQDAGTLDEKIVEYREVLRREPGNAEKRGLLGFTLVRNGSVQEGIEEILAAIKLKPDSALLHGQLALAYTISGAKNEAYKAWKNAIALDPTSESYRMILGLYYCENGQLKEGVTEYNAALTINPKNYDVHVLLGLALYHMGDVDNAYEHGLKAKKLDPKRPEAFVILGRVLHDRGLPKRAIPRLKTAIKIDKDNVEALTTLASCLASEGLHRKSVKDLERAVRIDPDNAIIRDNLALALINIGNFDEALIHAKRAVELEPRRTEFRQSLSGVYHLKRQSTEAVREAQEAVRIDPSNAMAYHALGTANIGARNFNDALAHLEHAVELQPDSIFLRRSLADAYAMVKKRDQAIKQLEEIVRIDPHDVAAYRALGDNYFRQGKFDLSEAPWRKAAELSPNSREDADNLARALSKTGRADEAVKELERYLATNPENQMDQIAAQFALDDIKREMREREPVSQGSHQTSGQSMNVATAPSPIAESRESIYRSMITDPQMPQTDSLKEDQVLFDFKNAQRSSKEAGFTNLVIRPFVPENIKLIRSLDIGGMQFRAGGDGIRFIEPAVYLLGEPIHSSISPRDRLVHERLKAVFLYDVSVSQAARTFVYHIDSGEQDFLRNERSSMLWQDIDAYHRYPNCDRYETSGYDPKNGWDNGVRSICWKGDGTIDIQLTAGFMDHKNSYFVVQTSSYPANTHSTARLFTDDPSFGDGAAVAALRKFLECFNRSGQITSDTPKDFLERSLKVLDRKVLRDQVLIDGVRIKHDDEYSFESNIRTEYETRLYSKEFGLTLDYMLFELGLINMTDKKRTMLNWIDPKGKVRFVEMRDARWTSDLGEREALFRDYLYESAHLLEKKLLQVSRISRQGQQCYRSAISTNTLFGTDVEAVYYAFTPRGILEVHLQDSSTHNLKGHFAQLFNDLYDEDKSRPIILSDWLRSADDLFFDLFDIKSS